MRPVTAMRSEEMTAVLRDKLAAAADGDLQARSDLFERSDVDMLRTSGHTRAQAAAIVKELLGPMHARRVVDDLNSYGSWFGDEPRRGCSAG